MKPSNKTYKERYAELATRHGREVPWVKDIAEALDSLEAKPYFVPDSILMSQACFESIKNWTNGEVA